MTSRKIKLADKSEIKQPRDELLQVADSVAREKGITAEEALLAMEAAIEKSVRSNYGADHNIRVTIDRTTGEIHVFRVLTVVECVENDAAEISLRQAIALQSNAKVGDELTEELPPFRSRRAAAQSARQTIIAEIRKVEREHQFSEFIDRKGQIVSGIVKQSDFSQVIIEIGHTEGVLRKSDSIPRQNFRPGDRVKALLLDVRPESAGPMLILSRTHPDFLKGLFEQEVTEVYDGVVQIVSVARDPGSRAKMAVYAQDQRIDAVGSCVGVRGSRVQSVTNELQGEKIDIVLWSSDPATYIMNALSLQEVKRVIIDEVSGEVEVIVTDNILSQAIGRRGQNVRLASILTGWKISVISETDNARSRAQQQAHALQILNQDLGVDDITAQLLVSEGFMSPEDIAQSDPEQFLAMEGLGREKAAELLKKASAVVQEQEQKFFQRCEELGVKDDLLTLEGVDMSMLSKMIEAGIRTSDDVADLSNDELLEIVGSQALSLEAANEIIMEARKAWFSEEASHPSNEEGL